MNRIAQEEVTGKEDNIRRNGLGQRELEIASW